MPAPRPRPYIPDDQLAERIPDDAATLTDYEYRTGLILGVFEDRPCLATIAGALVTIDPALIAQWVKGSPSYRRMAEARTQATAARNALLDRLERGQ